MKNNYAIEKYEELLLDANTHFYLSGTAKEKEENALSIIRYIITTLLGWTPEEAMNSINEDIVQKMHIDKLLMYIDFSKDVAKNDDYDYIIYLAFPNEVNYNPYKKIIKLYEKILRGEMLKFPKGYFNKSADGYIRANCLLLYAIQKRLSFRENDLFSIFKLFANTPVINKKLKEWKLLAACKALYNGDALRYLYSSMETEENINFIYNNFEFNKFYENFSANLAENAEQNL